MNRRANYLPFGKPDFSGGEIDAVTKVLRSGWVGMGPETIAFEKELCEMMRSPNVVTVSSCTAALTLSLLVSGVRQGDEVICPSLTWCSTANAAVYLGAVPVFCDIDPLTLCATEETILAKLTSLTRAVVIVHYGGLAVDAEKLRKALPPDVALIEDAAHALGACYEGGAPVGSSGNLTCFSFYANKNLSTGEGGAIAVEDAEIATRLRSLRQHGLAADAWQRFSHPKAILTAELVELGYKMNYTDLQACIGRVQLRRLPEFHAKRLAIAKCYQANLLGQGAGLSFQAGILEERHARHLLPVLLPIDRMKFSRNEFVIELRNRMVGAAIHYAPLHQMDFYQAQYSQSPLEVTERTCERVLTLPISASMSLQDAQYTVQQFNEVMEGCLT